MKHLMLATAALLGLATAGPALAERAQVKQLELAASGLPQPDSDARATNYALNGLPQEDTTTRGTQLAASGLPQPETAARGTQLAASGLDWARQAHLA